MTIPTPAPDDDHTSDGRCKYPATCAVEGRHVTPTPATPEPTEPPGEKGAHCGWMADRLPHTAHGNCDGFLPHLAEGLQRLMDRQAPTEDQR